MSCVIVSEAHSNPHAGWLPVDDCALKLSAYLGAPVYHPPALEHGRLVRRLPHLLAEPLRHEAPDGDTLIVIARNPSALDVINHIRGVRRRFKKVLAWVTDSYFYQGYGQATKHYDLIAVTDHADAEWIQRNFGTQTITIRQGIDTFSIVPSVDRPRSIDLMGFGRMPPKYHEAFKRRFHSPTSPYLYLHSPIGHQTGSVIWEERSMLLKTLQRTRFSLAFHMLCNPEINRPKSMMVTSRWLESLAAGCIVVGKRPISAMADEMLSWPDSTIELPDDPATAVDALEELLQTDEAKFEENRRTNMRNTMRYHDLRSRIADLLDAFGIDRPQALSNDLEELKTRLQHL